MRILLVIDSIHCGGAQRQLCYLAHGLKTLGHEVSVFVYRPEYDFFKPYLEEKEIEIIYCHRNTKFQTSRQIAKTASARNCDWVISYLDGPNFYSIMARQLLLFSARRFKVCVSDRSSTDDGVLRGKARLMRQYYRFANLVTANSNYHANTLRENIPAIQNRVHAIMNCVDDRFFENRIDPNSFDVSKSPSLAVVGQINHGKNLHGLIEAMRICREKRERLPTIKWAGRIGEGSEQYYQEQLDKIAEYRLEENFEFLGSIDDIPRFLSTSNALIHPSLREGLPNVVCEAMTVGLPVAIGRISDAEILVGTERGFLFDPEVPEDIANSIALLTQLDPGQSKRISMAATAFSDDNFKTETMAQKYLDAMASA